MGKPLSWQWKLVLGSVVLSLLFLGYVFTEDCHDSVVRRIHQEYMAMPESERRESAWADRFLFWAGFKGSVCGDWKIAAGMLKEFCGLPKDYKVRAYDYVMSPNFKKDNGKKAFVGKTSQDGMAGWGPMHPDAPEAFYDYLCFIEPNEVGATTGNESKVYFILFYDWHIKHSPDHMPHPKFNKFWDKIRQKILNGRTGVGEIPTWDFNAKKALPWKEPK
ncbi:MAG: hypothetical protein WCT04_12880 [Planctomycetota bacterium]